jgi:copper transport protein
VPRRPATALAAPILSALILSLALLAPASALAHAQLEGTSPARGAVVEREPAAVVFRFDEPVEGSFGAVRVYDADGSRVDEGDAFHPGGDGPRLGVHLQPSLPDGSYTATYRVVSADGHIVSSGFVFSIGKAGQAPKQTVAELTAGAGSGPVTETAFGLARGLQYTAIALGVGALAFLLAVWLPALAAIGGSSERWVAAARAFAIRLRRVLLGSAALGALSAAAAVVLEGAEAAGVSGFSALRETILRETLETRFGGFWGLAALAWVLFGLFVMLAPRLGQRRPDRLPAALLAMPLAFLVAVPALSGHATTQSPVALLLPVNVIHVAAMAVWLGGLTALLFVLPAGTRRLDPAERSRLLAAALARFSPLALIAVAAILLTGLVQAYVYVRHLDALLETGYGRAVLAKLILLAAVIAIGAYNRRRSLPRLNRLAAGDEAPGRAGQLLRRALRGEVALLVVVLGVTAALASYAPPVSAQAGPFSAESSFGPIQLELSVEPARVGANQIHLYLFDARSGAPFAAVKQLQVTAALPGKGISLPLEPRFAGPGHYTIPSAFLNPGGEWRLTVAVRVSAFDEYASSVEVPVG